MFIEATTLKMPDFGAGVLNIVFKYDVMSFSLCKYFSWKIDAGQSFTVTSSFVVMFT